MSGHNQGERNGIAGAEPPRCPRCGSELQMRVLEIEDEGLRETLLLFDCPRNDFHATATRDDLAAVMAAAVRAQLGF
jgi:hypothetical protein